MKWAAPGLRFGLPCRKEKWEAGREGSRAGRHEGKGRGLQVLGKHPDAERFYSLMLFFVCLFVFFQAKGTRVTCWLWENNPRDTHQGLHHVGLVVTQRFHDVEHVDDILLLDHLTHTADGTEGSAAASPVSKHRAKR